MKRLRVRISMGFGIIVLVTIALISLISNICISNEFEQYVEERQRAFAAELADGLSSQYDRETQQWNLDYIHGFGMVALSDGYLIKVYDIKEKMIWDAENHDMTLCHETMQTIQSRMEEERPDVEGEFVSYRYELRQNGELAGYADICYYTPYYLNETDFHFLGSLNNILLVIGIFCLCGAVAAGLFLAGRITKPISSTIDISKEISQGNYGIRLEKDVKTRELQDLQEAVNYMAESLRQQESLRKRLTTDVAHELRTPLTNASTYLEAIIEGVFEPTRERMKLLYDELERITKIVTELEQLHQAENNNRRMSNEPVDLYELARIVRNAFEQELAEKQLTCVLEGNKVTVMGDKSKLHQVVFNLLSNAIKYSFEGGTIQIQVEALESGAVFRVIDQGIGIPKEDLPLVFERFYRTDLSRSRRTGGVGIGLTIVKSIVQAHGGAIEVESEEGKGSCFELTLPYRGEASS